MIRPRLIKVRALDVAPRPPTAYLGPTTAPDPSERYAGAARLLALCLCEAEYVRAPAPAVKAGAVYCDLCAPSSAICELCSGRHSVTLCHLARSMLAQRHRGGR